MHTFLNGGSLNPQPPSPPLWLRHWKFHPVEGISPYTPLSYTQVDTVQRDERLSHVSDAASDRRSSHGDIRRQKALTAWRYQSSLISSVAEHVTLSAGHDLSCDTRWSNADGADDAVSAGVMIRSRRPITSTRCRPRFERALMSATSVRQNPLYKIKFRMTFYSSQRDL